MLPDERRRDGVPGRPGIFDATLELRFRSTTKLALDAFGPQDDIRSSAPGTLVFDQRFVATQRIGCMP